jgi:hypothetical protein
MSKGLLYTLVGLIATFAIAAFTIVFSTNLQILAVVLLLVALAMSGVVFMSLKRTSLSQPSNDIYNITNEPQPNPNRAGIIIAGFVFVILLISTVYAISRLLPTGTTPTNSPTHTATPYHSVGQSSGGSAVEPEPIATPSTIQSAQSGEIKTTRPFQGRIAAGYNYTVALKDDGTVVCIGGNGDIYVENWSGIKQIAGYGNHVLGLYENGTVAFTGKSVSGEKKVTGWSDIVQVAACYQGSIGLKSDGSVVYTGFDKNKLSDCQSWRGIKRILGGEDHIVGLTNSGNIVTSGYNGGGSGDGRRQDFNFNNVVEGFAASGTTFCVFSDGSVAAYGTDWAGENMIGGWSDIVAIVGGDEHTIGLKNNGTVVAMGSNEHGQCNVKGWSDIIAVYCGQFHTVGLKSDGTLVATGLNDFGQCNVGGVRLW